MSSVLSEDQKRKIEQEEAARVAEEEYRQQVRRNLRSSPSRPAPGATSAPTVEHGVRIGRGFWLGLQALLVTGAVAAYVYSVFPARGDSISEPSTTQPQWETVTNPIVRTQFEVPATRYLSWSIVVPEKAVRDYHLTGHFSAVGGGGNDIEAVIASEDEFQNWINGHEAHVFYSTPGRVTTGKMDVALPAGRYVLAFNNRFSLFTSKAVYAEIDAVYEKAK